MNRNIVIVEDNAGDILLLEEALKQHDVQCTFVVYRDGAEAIEYARTANAGETPSLVILDLNLPRRHGLEVLEEIRRSPALQGVPVAVCTTSDSPTEKQLAEQYGVQAYLHKPVGLDEFLAMGAVFKRICEGESDV